MNFKRWLAGLVLAAGAGASVAAPSCYSTTSWNSLGPPDVEFFGNTFNSAGERNDCYTFSLDSSASAFGGAIEINTLFNQLDIDIISVSLYLGNTLLGTPDTSPLAFSFGGLAGGGLYTLVVSSTVTNDPGLWSIPVGYAGVIATVAAPVPEPGAVALALAGLAGVGALARRRRG